MVEGIENNPDVWQKIFPDNERCELARNFTEKISKIDGVEVVLSVSRRQETGFNMQSIFVLVSDNINACEAERIKSCYREICSDYIAQNSLGHIYVGSEVDFLKSRRSMFDLRYQIATTLWQRPSMFSGEIGYQRNFNGDLN